MKKDKFLPKKSSSQFQFYTHDGQALPPVLTLIGERTHLNGVLRFETSLAICGSYEGSIHSTGFLYIADKARIKADIHAQIVIVAGVVEGNIEALDQIELLPTARVYGKIRSARIRLTDGCILEGQCEMISGVSTQDIFSSTPEQLLSQLHRNEFS